MKNYCISSTIFISYIVLLYFSRNCFLESIMPFIFTFFLYGLLALFPVLAQEYKINSISLNKINFFVRNHAIRIIPKKMNGKNWKAFNFVINRIYTLILGMKPNCKILIWLNIWYSTLFFVIYIKRCNYERTIH